MTCLRSLLAPMLAALVLAGCGGGGGDEAAAVRAPDACAPDRLETVERGRLTVATDDPAYPPYFVDGDPSNGKGFEGALAYAIARELGFERRQVRWRRVPFKTSYAPGPSRSTWTSTRSRSHEP